MGSTLTDTARMLATEFREDLESMAVLDSKEERESRSEHILRLEKIRKMALQRLDTEALSRLEMDVNTLPERWGGKGRDPLEFMKIYADSSSLRQENRELLHRACMVLALGEMGAKLPGGLLHTWFKAVREEWNQVLYSVENGFTGRPILPSLPYQLCQELSLQSPLFDGEQLVVDPQRIVDMLYEEREMSTLKLMAQIEGAISRIQCIERDYLEACFKSNVPSSS